MGSFGNFSSFSFYANKNITCAEGGMLYCKNSQHAKRARLLKSHGLNRSSFFHYKNFKNKYDVLESGFNYRLDDVRASLASSQLKRVNKNNFKRYKLFMEYNKNLINNKKIWITFKNYKKNNYSRHLYTITSNFVVIQILNLSCQRTTVVGATP